MFSILRVSLLAFLVLLQLLAPLVHAHAGPTDFAAGVNAGKLHIPGLEAFSIAQDALLDGKPIGQCREMAINTPSEGMVVGVNTGMRQVQQDMLHYAENVCHLHPCLLMAAVFFPLFDFAPPGVPFVHQLTHTAHTPRAPPVLLA